MSLTLFAYSAMMATELEYIIHVSQKRYLVLPPFQNKSYIW